MLGRPTENDRGYSAAMVGKYRAGALQSETSWTRIMR
jgi:hypothetical protein